MRPVAHRARLPGSRLRSTTDVADPSRGTRVAVGFPCLALLLAALCVYQLGWQVRAPAAMIVSLAVAAAAAERIVVQLGPRSWYTASTPVIVLTGLLGGPLAGLAAGAATQLARPEAVWRRRLAEGGIGAVQGLAAGSAGLVAWHGGTGATLVAVAALASAVAVNSAGRLLIMLERRATPLARTFWRGVAVDCLELLLMAPVLAVLLLASGETPVLVVLVVLALLASLVIAKRTRETTAAALALEQANARRDQLTGAPNRRAFEEAMAAEHARVVRGALPAGLYLIDIDRFKSINDRHGHRIGDQVLVEVVGRLVDGLRPSDVVARWGGEEITVLAPGVRHRRQLEQVGERIRMLVGARPVPTATAAVPVTVSVGCTLLDGSVSPAAALHLADEALYEAKRTRDTSAVALPPRLPLRLESAS